MKPKDYQKRTLEAVQDFLEQLAFYREKSKKLQAIDPDISLNHVQSAWEKIMPERTHIPRKNGLGQPLPTFCLKVPTGGGKTYLATRTIDLINQCYLKTQTGLVLWIVPSTQIYRQTLDALKDRDHPYRQSLDMASAGRTLILEKTNGFSPSDVKENLCVLVLMLPSANRKTKDTLRMFKDSGGFDRFFPRDDDQEGHRKLLKRIHNLDTFEKEDGFWGRQIKTSLGNTLRLLNPVVVLDEGQKAYSMLAKETIEGFNPSIMVELSATPPKEANVLVEILGKQLKDEEMIKLDLHIQNRSSTNWKDTLLSALERRKHLEVEAREHEARTNHYIRPICLIQVERTGKEQRKAGMIHAEDVREYLLTHSDITPDQIAIKTSHKDELKDVDEVGGLLSRDCPIRFIITKQALQEGWDCSFAYVLAVLTNPSSKSALTQLVGRILRQPYARKTGNRWLDESYVFCFQRKGNALLEEIRKGFGLEGLGDLQRSIIEDKTDSDSADTSVTYEPRNDAYKKAVKDLVLPAFMINDRKEWRLVHYEADILSRVPWESIDITPMLEATALSSAVQDKDVEMRAGLEESIFDESIESRAISVFSDEEWEIDLAFAASHLTDVMPNPWRASEIVLKVFKHLRNKYDHVMVRGNFVYILEEIRKHLEVERDRLAREVFEGLVKDGTVRFIVVTDDLNFNRLPQKIIAPKKEKRANREDGRQFELNLFEHVPEDGFNNLESKVASYLDEQAMLFFWFRNVSRQNYYVQGWKRNKIFADFILTSRTEGVDKNDPFNRVFVLETKGLHLKRTADTDYKRDVFGLCNKLAKQKDWSDLVPTMKSKVVKFEVIDEDEWQNRLNQILA